MLYLRNSSDITRLLYLNPRNIQYLSNVMNRHDPYEDRIVRLGCLAGHSSNHQTDLQDFHPPTSTSQKKIFYVHRGKYG